MAAVDGVGSPNTDAAAFSKNRTDRLLDTRRPHIHHSLEFERWSHTLQVRHKKRPQYI